MSSVSRFVRLFSFKASFRTNHYTVQNSAGIEKVLSLFIAHGFIAIERLTHTPTKHVKVQLRMYDE